MLRLRTLMAAAVCALTVASPATAASPDLVVSQVYGGGGSGTATRTHDFVELFNRGTSSAALDGRSVQYASATGTGHFQSAALPDVTLRPGQAFLLQLAGGTTGAPLPEPDATGSLSLAAVAGKVALVDQKERLACNGGSAPCSPEQEAKLLDLVGYGAASYSETRPAPALSTATAAHRAGNGCIDTDDNSADFTAAAPEPRNSASEPQPCDPVPGDTAPAVASTSPADGASDVARDATLSVTFSEPVDAAAGAFELTCAGGGVAITVSGGPEAYQVDPAGDLPSGAACALSVHASAVTDRDGRPDTPADDRTVRFTTAEACGDPGTSIPAIQGAGARSPRTGERVATEGVVIGDFDGLGGFFVQDPVGDGDADTSDGVFVHDPDGVPDVADGDLVRVSGTVTEFERSSGAGSMTQLTGVAVLSCGHTEALPDPAPLVFPQDRGDLERLEGMRVRTTQDLTVTELYTLRFGEVLLSAGGPLVQPTEVMAPGPDAAAADRDATDRTVLLDDGRSGLNVDPIRFTSEADALRRGDLVAPVEGALAFDFGLYRIQPTSDPAVEERNPRPVAPEDVGGDVRAGSFNVLNYFVTFGRGEDRGAPNGREFAEQQAKVVAAINAQDASVLGLQEIQDTSDEEAYGHDPDAALDDLVAALNAAAGHRKWAKSPVPRPFGNTDEIRVAQIHQPGDVTPIGDPVALPDPVFADLARVPVAQTYRAGTERFTVIVNHFKSKGCGGATGADADQGDGQSCFNATRLRQAQALLRFVDDRRAATDDDDVLVVGDLNAYSAEDPIRALEQGGLVNVHAAHEAAGDRYSYVFNGRQGVLDHALATSSLAAKVTGSDLWHVNADESRVEEYGGFRELYTRDPYRSSDHDAALVGIDASEPPTCRGRTATIVGTDADDVLRGTDGDDVIVAFEGADTVDGGNGADLVCAGTGDDAVAGGNGDDDLGGGPGDDALDGGNGDDTLRGGPGEDDLDGGRGEDVLLQD